MIFRKFLMFASRGTTPKFTLEVKSDNAGTSGANQFTIPTFGSATYLYDYYTSDGQSGTGITGDETITFASGAGTYEIYITGTFPRTFFGGTGDSLKLLRVLEWGDYGAGETDQGGAFQGCDNLTSIADDVGNINLITLGVNMFVDCGFASLPSGLTFPNLTNGLSLLQGCGNLLSLPSGMAFASLTNGNSTLRSTGITALPSVMVLDNLEIATNFTLGTALTDLPSGMTLPSLTTASNIFQSSNINVVRYSQLLVDMESGNPNNNVSFGAGVSKYNATGKVARDILTGGVRLWTITDGGLEP